MCVCVCVCVVSMHSLINNNMTTVLSAADCSTYGFCFTTCGQICEDIVTHCGCGNCQV